MKKISINNSFHQETPIFNQILPSFFFKEMKSEIQILGSSFEIQQENNVIVLLSSNSNLFTTTTNDSSIKIKPTLLKENSISFKIPKITENFNSISLFISFNNGNYFHKIQDINLLG